MQGGEITLAGLLILGIGVLWKGISYLLDHLFKKSGDNEEETSSKLDTILEMVRAQAVTISTMSAKIDHSYDDMKKIERKEEQLRDKVTDLESSMAEIKEWKRLASK